MQILHRKFKYVARFQSTKINPLSNKIKYATELEITVIGSRRCFVHKLCMYAKNKSYVYPA